MKVIYIAGSYRATNAWLVEQNVRRAEEAAHYIISHAAKPVVCLVPHSLGRFFNGTMTAEYWLDATLELMRRCDAVYVLPGSESSAGTRGEVAEANRLRLPVLISRRAVLTWISNGV